MCYIFAHQTGSCTTWSAKGEKRSNKLECDGVDRTTDSVHSGYIHEQVATVGLVS